MAWAKSWQPSVRRIDRIRLFRNCLLVKCFYLLKSANAVWGSENPFIHDGKVIHVCLIVHYSNELIWSQLLLIKNTAKVALHRYPHSCQYRWCGDGIMCQSSLALHPENCNTSLMCLKESSLFTNLSLSSQWRKCYFKVLQIPDISIDLLIE